jgi:Predicted membrane protein (DUF2254)
VNSPAACLGIRQLVDIACKALSPGINDPYPVVQSTEHLAVIFAMLAALPSGDRVAAAGSAVVVVPQRTTTEHLGAVEPEGALVVAAAERTDMLPADIEVVREAAAALQGEPDERGLRTL